MDDPNTVKIELIDKFDRRHLQLGVAGMYKFDLEDLMDTIYAAPLDGTKWQNILGFTNKTFPETRTSIVFYDGRVDYDAAHSLHDFDTSAMGTYGEYYASVNPWVAANERTPLGKTTFSRDYVPTKDLKQSEFFNDWLRFQGDVDEGIGAVLARDSERIGLLGIHYLSEKMCPYRLDELKIFCDVLAPHLQRAFEMRRRMEGLESRADRLEATLDLLAGAVFILTSRGRVQYANKRAEQYLHLRNLVAALRRASAPMRRSVSGSGFRASVLASGYDSALM